MKNVRGKNRLNPGPIVISHDNDFLDIDAVAGSVKSLVRLRDFQEVRLHSRAKIAFIKDSGKTFYLRNLTNASKLFKRLKKAIVSNTQLLTLHTNDFISEGSVEVPSVARAITRQLNYLNGSKVEDPATYLKDKMYEVRLTLAEAKLLLVNKPPKRCLGGVFAVACFMVLRTPLEYAGDNSTYWKRVLNNYTGAENT